MKNSRFITFSFLVAMLLGCSPRVSSVNSTSSELSKTVTDPLSGVTLDRDFATDYEIDKSVSNKDGSMSYEIFVRSYYDTNGDGIGDLNGVKEKIPYLHDLGIKTLWLMPIMPSPTYHGYDVTDYFNVHKDYGTIEDFKNLVKTAEEYNIDIMIDMVLNHCSKKHQYFLDSYNDYNFGYYDEGSNAEWFNWGVGNSTYNGVRYEARFDAAMPDFNLDCPAVREEIDKIFKFWIEDCGVKGFRLDAVLYYYYQDTARNIEFMNFLVDTAKKYDENFYMVGECWKGDAIVNQYAASKLDSFFRFGQASGGELSFINLAKGFGRADNYASTIEQNEANCKKNNPNYYSSYFLSNHDQDRISKNFPEEISNKAAASLYGLMPGTPFMYYGEEIQLKGKRVTAPEDYSDVRRRLPMIWSKEDKTGECDFPEKNRQDLNKKNNQVEEGVYDKLNENFSLLKHYQKVINVRNKYPFMKNGAFKNLTKSLNTTEASMMAYKISLGDEYIVVVHNFASYAIEVTSPANEIVDEINTSHLKPKLENGKLSIAAHSTVIMK